MSNREKSWAASGLSTFYKKKGALESIIAKPHYIKVEAMDEDCREFNFEASARTEGEWKVDLFNAVIKAAEAELEYVNKEIAKLTATING